MDWLREVPKLRRGSFQAYAIHQFTIRFIVAVDAFSHCEASHCPEFYTASEGSGGLAGAAHHGSGRDDP